MVETQSIKNITNFTTVYDVFSLKFISDYLTRGCDEFKNFKFLCNELTI